MVGTGTEGSVGTIAPSSYGTFFGSVISAMTNRDKPTRVTIVSCVSRVPGVSKSNRMGKNPDCLSASRMLSKTASLSGVKRPSIKTTFLPIVSMTCLTFGLFKTIESISRPASV